MNNDMLKEWGITVLQFFIVAFIVLGIPYMLSGVWPPFVSVISGSMEPNINQGDMILIEGEQRFNDSVDVHGVRTSASSDKINFGRDGDVIVYKPNGRDTVPVIHRAVVYVKAGENWTDDVDSNKLPTQNCTRLRNCPAPNSGFITLGDNNDRYDQAGNISRPVKQEWIIGRAKYRIPYVGWLRILVGSVLS